MDLSDLHIKEMVNYIVLKSIIDTTDEKDLHDAIKERLDELIPKHVTNEDIISSISYLLNLEHGLGIVDDRNSYTAIINKHKTNNIFY